VKGRRGEGSIAPQSKAAFKEGEKGRKGEREIVEAFASYYFLSKI
jgi:hypothetical protein